MLIRILAFILETIFFFLIAAALLRAWMNWVRVNMRGQPGSFVMALTDWLVKPLRRTLPKSLGQARIDWASLLAAVVLAVLYALVWALLFGVLMAAPGVAAGFTPLALLGPLVYAGLLRATGSYGIGFVVCCLPSLLVGMNLLRQGRAVPEPA